MPTADDPDGMPIPFGIYADTGLSFDGLDEGSLNDFIKNDESDSALQEYLAVKVSDSAPHLGVVGDIRDPNHLNETGWCAIFGPSVDDRTREALEPLLKHRGMGVNDPALYRVFQGDTAPRPGESAESWLRRQKVGMDVVRPSLGVPYYVLIVAPPDEISFEFQYALDVFWAVGRIWFPEADDFRQYAESVVRYETMPAADLPTSRQMAVFAPCLDFDVATQLFSRQVAQTIVSGSDYIPAAGKPQKFALQPFIGATATKDTLSRIWSGGIDGGPPALLFSGGHGAWFRPNDTNQQAELQGALVCQDRQARVPMKPDYYFAASDLPAGGKMHGMIHFMFACYGGGWPEADTYSRLDGTPATLAPRPMLARLPQKLLSHPDGGALAVIAHVDRSWGYSFRDGNNPRTQGFSDVLAKIMWGDRLGQATDQFNVRWASLSTKLAETLDRARSGLTVDPKALGYQWVARDDARNYIVIGDPAVQLRVNDMPVLNR
jgi:hypothetical protein